MSLAFYVCPWTTFGADQCLGTAQTTRSRFYAAVQALT